MNSRPKFVMSDGSKSWQQDKADIDAHNSTQFVYNANNSLPYDLQRQRLPIFKLRSHIIYLLDKFQTLVLVGETGCGKSTQIPQYLLEAGWSNDGKIIGVTEPRRVAATSLANRIADEQNCILGTKVGYTIRFDNNIDETTKIKYMTEGILLNEIRGNPLLTNYSVIILDEVHERSTLTDIIMGLLRKILQRRKSLRVIVLSATVDEGELYNFFNLNSTKDPTKDTVTILSVEGRMHPVNVFYSAEPVANYVDATIETVLKIHEKEEPGDILAFLTGIQEVDRAVSLLLEHAKLLAAKDDNKLGLYPVPMYGSLTNAEQLDVFRRAPNNARKVVVATNIAESSITVPNVVYVIDCGFAKLPWFEVETQTNSLVVAPISKASADQRSGRAGRTKPGKTYRLYSEEVFENMAEFTPPEVQRTNLMTAVIRLKALGIDNVLRFNFPSSPPRKNLLAAIELLHALDAINAKGELTPDVGMIMAEIDLEPPLVKCLIAASDMGCLEEMVTVIAMLQVQNVFIKPNSGQEAIKARIAHRNFEVEEGDLITLLNVYLAYEKYKRNNWCRKYYLNQKALLRVTEIRGQIVQQLRKYNLSLESCGGNVQLLIKALTMGLFPYAAYLHYTGVYRTIRGREDLSIHPDSCLYTVEQPQWVIFYETLQTNKTYMRYVTVIKSEWLTELAPHFYRRAVIEG